MYVDIYSLVMDTGVPVKISIFLMGDKSGDSEYGFVEEDVNKTKADEENVFCAMVENVDDVADYMNGSYISRVSYDFYIPSEICYKYELSGATIKTEDGREFTVTREPLKRKYVSHCVVNATENNMRYDGGGML